MDESSSGSSILIFGGYDKISMFFNCSDVNFLGVRRNLCLGELSEFNSRNIGSASNESSSGSSVLIFREYDRISVFNCSDVNFLDVRQDIWVWMSC